MSIEVQCKHNACPHHSDVQVCGSVNVENRQLYRGMTVLEKSPGTSGCSIDTHHCRASESLEIQT